MFERDLYASFADVLSLGQSMKDDLAALLDPQTGFAPRMRELCKQQIETMEEQHGLPEELELLKLEENTWRLLQAVLPARKTEHPPTPSARALLETNPYTPSSTLAQAILQSSPLLTELVVVREWLQDTAPPPPIPEATTGYWKFTKHNVLQGLRSGNTYRDGLVKELDPDAPNRGDGRALASDDASYEKALLQALYACVRAGKLDEAVELCRRAHQPWRAASLLGSRLFTWPAISTEPKEEDAMDDDEEEFWSGNKRRKLWKKTCVQSALNNALPDQERILYAALTPSPSTFTILKSACRTWEDHLWAQVSILCEERESMELCRLHGSFWENGIEDDESEEDTWETEVIESLETLQDVAPSEGPGAEQAFHFSQLRIILGRMDELLTLFAGALANDEFKQNGFEHAQLCRFFAHLCLFLQLIDIPTPPHATQNILEAYLQVLEDAEQRPLIAMYAGALGDNAVERYALFLVSLALNADVGERKLALTRASEHGLDMLRVAVVAAERTIEKAFEKLPQPVGPLPSIIALPHPLNDHELFLLRSIEWTTLHEETYGVALEQTNVILRYFLGMGRVQAALSLLDMLPSGLADISEPEERATEYLHYRQFFVIWETLERVVEQHAHGQIVGRMGKDERTEWLSRYRGSIDQAYERVTKLLTTEWLVSDVDQTGGDRRRRELVRIRQLYIPEIVIRLHFVLVNSRLWLPENLKRALELVNIVADSRYRLYDDFVNAEGTGKRRLGEYLGAVRGAFVAGLEKGGSDPFRPLLAVAS